MSDRCDWLEKKRPSITRLKLQNRISGKKINFQTWKEKTLDYEIETELCRLGLIRLPSWKEKTLDYEIETRRKSQGAYRLHFPWKEKTLDYEIETRSRCALKPTVSSLKRKDPRLRDWNWLSLSLSEVSETLALKRKDPRLRDWNIPLCDLIGLINILKFGQFFFADRHFAPLGLRRGARWRSINIPPRWGCSFEHPGHFSTRCICVRNGQKNQRCFENGNLNLIEIVQSLVFYSKA